MRTALSWLTTTGLFLMLCFIQTNVSSCTKEVIIRDTVTVTETDTVTIHNSDTCRITLQPHFNPDEVHFLGGSGIDQTNPDSRDIGAVSWTIGGSQVNVRAALKFDMSDIPAEAEILSAKLTLFSNPTPNMGNQTNANFGSDNTMLIQQLTSSFNKSSTWNTQPTSTTVDQLVIPHTTISHFDLVNIDVKTLVRKMHQTSNFGFFIKLQTEAYYNSRIFASSKHADFSKHPKLVIEYHMP